MKLQKYSREVMMRNFKLCKPYKFIQREAQFKDKEMQRLMRDHEQDYLFGSCEHWSNPNYYPVVDRYFYQQPSDIWGLTWFWRATYNNDGYHESGFVRSMIDDETFMSWFVNFHERRQYLNRN